MRSTSKRLPRARKDRLIVQELQDELMVYDLDRHKAHCLNPTAALIWKHCDGTTTVESAVSLLETRVDGEEAETVLWYSLGLLQKARLLAEPFNAPQAANGMTRRTLIHRIGLTAAFALPLVTSIVAPRAVDAASCVSSGGSCTASAQCCSLLCSTGSCA